MSEPVSSYWLDQLTDDIIRQHPRGKLVVSSGHSPSGYYHVGTLREILTANLIAWSLRQRGREAEHIDVVDDFDALRKIPTGINEAFSQYLGQPLGLAPDPFADGHRSYADHFLAGLESALRELGIQRTVIRSHEMYQQGKFTASIERSLSRLDEVKRIIREVGGRQLGDDWAPVQLLSDAKNLRAWTYDGWDADRHVIKYREADGRSGEINYAAEPGRVKLDWRLDWPARWAVYGVIVEPFGRDHATKGGSYDTGQALVQEIFDGAAPYPVPYEFVNLAGESKKMSKSAGNGVTPQDMLGVVPAEVLRYFFARPRPGRTLPFDPGLGLFNLLDEYSRGKFALSRNEQVTDRNALVYAGEINASDHGHETVAAVPFNHLVSIYQTAAGDLAQMAAILDRTGYAEAAKHPDDLKREAAFVASWLAKYAPASVKFEIQAQPPTTELSAEQEAMLRELAAIIEEEGELDGQGMHDAIYEAAQSARIMPGQAFQTLYLLILGQKSGPKAGWFLASLDRDWLLGRLRRQG